MPTAPSRCDPSSTRSARRDPGNLFRTAGLYLHMTELLPFAGLLIAWWLLQSVILPKLGVAT